uniref:Uncharacterized protein n=1 Tax=Poecilia reticulata TaxID=8081 RepID=A0A3P9PVQ5_POERE
MALCNVTKIPITLLNKPPTPFRREPDLLTYHNRALNQLELTELRNMVLQNRVVLDFLSASQGGVCKIIGPACCTFVPDKQELVELFLML